jgi:hypothetical protein
MTPLSINASNTIGLVDMHNPHEDFVMEIDPSLLKAWADMVADNFTGEDVVYLAVHKLDDPMQTARCLSASAEYGDEIQVMVCGTDCDDVVKKGISHTHSEGSMI